MVSGERHAAGSSRLHGFPCFPYSVISIACFSRSYASCESCAISPERQTGCFIEESIVAERLSGLDAQCATGGKADCKGNDENEHNDGQEIGERVRRAEA